MLLDDLIIWVKETFPKEYAQLDFLTDAEWCIQNANAPWLLEAARSRIRREECNFKCHENDNLIEQGICKGVTIGINVKVSNYYKRIVFSERDCNYVIEHRRKALIEDHLIDSGIYGELLNKTFDNYSLVNKNPEYISKVNKCIDYAKNFKDYNEKGLGLYIHGRHGNGKTHLAIATALEVLYGYYIPIKYSNLQNLIAKYKGMLSSGTFENFKLLSDVGEFEGLLILDDIGTENDTRRNVEICYSIVNYRYDNYLPTIYTSNYNLSQLGNERFSGDEGSKIADRILGRSEVLSFNLESYRSKEYDKLKKD